MSRVPFTKHVLCGISLHLDYLMEGIKEGKIEASPEELAVIEALFYRIDGYEAAFETPAHALTYQATLVLMMEALGKFYDGIHEPAKQDAMT